MKRILTGTALAALVALAGCQSGTSPRSANDMSHVSASNASVDIARSTENSAVVPAFVQTACADCHAVTATNLSPNPSAPSFENIANRNGLTKATLSAFLIDAHNYPDAMDFELGPEETEALSDYILTLKKDSYNPIM